RGLLSAVGTGKSVMFGDGMIRPILLPFHSANHMFPSGPAAIANGRPELVGMGKFVTMPAVLVRRIELWLLTTSVNQRLPSVPAAMSQGTPSPGNSVTVPVVVIRPTPGRPTSVNQRLPSGPAAIPTGSRPD